MRLKQLLLMCMLLLLGFNARAKHIAGGDLWVTHQGGDKYTINLRFFRDCSLGENGPKFDATVTIGVFDKATNAMIDTFVLEQVKYYQTNVGNNSCISSNSCIDVTEYAKEVTLPIAKYNNTTGYYCSWQRCCRNGIIQNIDNPAQSGIAYYAEIPSPFPSGPTQFIDSHPIFNKAPVEFLCVGKALNYNFNMTDADGDSLVYSLVTPLRGNADTANILSISPGPYPEVDWAAGYDQNNAMAGSPELSINATTGTLNVTPQDIGVFVVAVKVEEYRNGLKIGEVRRELEMFVYDCKNSFSEPPVITSIAENTTVEFIVGQTNCIDFDVSDPESDKVNLSLESPDIDLAAEGATVTQNNNAGQTPLHGQFCWKPSCNLDDSKPIRVRILATDNYGCPIKNYDTLQFNIQIKKKVGRPPVIQLDTAASDLNFPIGRQSCIKVDLTDADSTDNLTTAIKTSPINIFSSGASYFQSKVTGKDENYSVGTLCWSPPCSVDVSQPISVQFITSDNSACPKVQYDTLVVQLRVIKTVDHKPELAISSIPADSTYVFTLGEENCITLQAFDQDKDSLLLKYSVKGFDLFNAGAQFDTDGGRGSFASKLCWTPSCQTDTAEKSSITVIITEQALLCDVPMRDTISYRIKLVQQPNAPPRAEAIDVNPNEPILFTAGVEKCLRVEISDPDQDPLLWQDRIVSGINLYYEGLAISFDTLFGNNIRATLCWKPKCTIDTSIVTIFEFGGLEAPNDCKTALKAHQQLKFKVQKPENHPPKLTLKTPAKELDWLLGVPHCLELDVKDPDKDSLHLDLFTTDYDVRSNGGAFYPNDGGDSLHTSLCWTPACNVLDTLVHALVVAADRGRSCIKDMGDTIRFDIRLTKPSNIAPVLKLSSPPDGLVFELGKATCLDFESLDANADSLDVNFYSLYYDIFKYGAFVKNNTGKDKINPQLCWTPPCNTDTMQTIRLDAVVVDRGRPCMIHKADTVNFGITLKQPVNTPPVVSLSRPEGLLKAELGKEICLDVFAKDDNPSDKLVVQPSFDPDIFQYGAKMDRSTLSGYGSVSSELCWTPPCDWDTLKHVRMTFSVSDNACAHPYTDSAKIKLDVIPQPNSIPRLLTEQDSSINLIAGDKLSFDVLANDADGDSLIITTVSTIPGVASFTKKTSAEELMGLVWQTNCADFRNKGYELQYKLRELGCAKHDSLVKRFTVNVVPNGAYKVPDVFTPNQDGQNDQFKLVETVPQRRYAPFYFGVYNRWGERIYETDTPYFEWTGENNPDGVYVYHLKSDSCPKEQTGFITIKR